MKKQILVALISIIPAISFAKVSDFNTMISDNQKDQQQLHKSVNSNVADANKVVRQGKRERLVFVEDQNRHPKQILSSDQNHF